MAGRKGSKQIIEEILDSLRGGEKSIHEIAIALDSNWKTVEEYLDLLKKQNIVNEIPTKNKRYFSLSTPIKDSETMFGIPIQESDRKIINFLYANIKKQWKKTTNETPNKTQVQKTLAEVNKRCSLNLPIGWYLYGTTCLKFYDPQFDYPTEKISNQKEIETCIAKVIEELKEYKTTSQLRRHQYQNNKLYATKEEIMSFTLIPQTKDQFTSLLTNLLRYSSIKDEELAEYLKEFVCISIQALNTSKDFFALKGLIYEAFLEIWKLIAMYNLQQSLIATKKYTEESLKPYLNFDFQNIHQQIAEICSFVPEEKELEEEYRRFIGISKNKKPLSKEERKQLFEEFVKTDTSDIFRKLNLH